MPMLKVPDHQVAGHRALDGKLGPLIDESGHFYKPLQQNERGLREAEFYQTFSSDVRVPDHIRKFFPKFFGTQLLEASDGSGPCSHLVMEDLTSNYKNPSIIDVKIGSRTWYPQASEKYIQKCLKKDQETSSLSLGFRISGLHLYQGQESGYWKPDRKLTMKYTADDVRLVLKKFISSNQSSESKDDPDCTFASSVLGGSSGILAQLLELKSWFEEQTLYHFYSCSVLMVYDKEESLVKTGQFGPAIKLVDFAHVLEGDGVIDHNFLGGLCSLIKFISDISSTPNGCTIKDIL
ncbi:inositol polyphosphate multikinase beta [Beta vulgaris subsp. vulgaris]|uniref:inositol polyphosphate multikinase beta n=1 Tax=Beta vulgaris subsp. vulgaris TaxID=3555 RepID=UPI002036CC58|nr:inositol polyphosphate multikinase beta [Beta vulgaris subsp. vulgaris]